MFGQIGGVIAQACAMLVALFSAGEKLAKSADNLATWAEETSGSFTDEARATRQQKLAALKHATEQQALKLASNNASTQP